MKNDNEIKRDRRVDNNRPTNELHWDDSKAPAPRPAGKVVAWNKGQPGECKKLVVFDKPWLSLARTLPEGALVYLDAPVAAPAVHSTTAAEIRANALEEAAQLCETKGYVTNYGAAAGQSCAAAIRALAGQQVAQGEKGGELQSVAAFLMGEADLEGVSFGERHPTKAGAFWWRHNLRAALHAAGLRPEHKS